MEIIENRSSLLILGSQYSDYMVLDYLCLPGASLSVCDHRWIDTNLIDTSHRLFLRSPNYPNEYENSLNCSCLIKTNKATMKILDFSLEERDEMNFCTRDYLQIPSQIYCDSTIDPLILLNTSTELIFKSNDVITRKGFWLMIDSQQSIEASCRNSFELAFPTSIPLMSTTRLMMLTTTNTSQTPSKHHRSTLSFILILILIFVVVLLVSNLLLVILCWKQRQMKSTTQQTHRPFFCSKRSETSSASSITYGDASLDAHKRQTTSTTTATTGIYEDPNEVLTLQRPANSSFYFQHGPLPKTFCPIILPAGYNPIAPVHCHLNTSAQTFYPLDSQHIYETIQDGHCPYQRLAATLRRQQQQCTCYCTHREQQQQQPPAKTVDHEKAISTETNPETLV